jgi:hypothetical protein
MFFFWKIIFKEKTFIIMIIGFLFEENGLQRQTRWIMRAKKESPFQKIQNRCPTIEQSQKKYR